MWPATFAFDNALAFDVVVVPDASDPVYSEYLTEEQAASYPQGRYELDVQIAAEDGDQSELDRLFRRRGRTETWRLGVFLLVVVLALAIAMKLLLPAQPRPRPAPPAGARAMMESDFARAKPRSHGGHRAHGERSKDADFLIKNSVVTVHRAIVAAGLSLRQPARERTDAG